MKFLSTILCLFLLLSCSKDPELNYRFKSLSSEQSGITFKNMLTNKPEWNALNYLYFYTGSGVAAGDFNNDGLEDLYFVSNQEEDHLYINKGNLQFENTAAVSGIEASQGWSTGVTTVDINADGLLDIYVSRLGKHMSMRGTNLLYVNQGANDSGIPIFKEQAAAFGLDLIGFNHQAAFFDYDLDGDLDAYILQYSVDPSSIYVDSKKRLERDSLAGGRLYRNDEMQFVDVSESAGIYSSAIGFGLGVAVSDVNDDGWPDLYVSNDFFENDYFYINQQDGTFKDYFQTHPEAFPHTSNFSMGNDIADLNNDLHLDILTLDMLPDDLETRITSESDIGYRQYKSFLDMNYHPQFIRNGLHYNDGTMHFKDLSFMAGVAATDWSWAGLIADLDNDGLKDIFITSGIYGATNDKDFVNFLNTDISPGIISENMKPEDLRFVDRLPQKKTPDYIYKNQSGIGFEEMSGDWYEKTNSFSSGAVYSDLDNDGDLDLVINKVNESAEILINTASADGTHYLKLQFKGKDKNTLGIGAKVFAYAQDLKLRQEHFLSRGYISGIAPGLHLGLGSQSKLDSLVVVYPDKTYQTLTDVAANQTLTLDQREASGDFYTRKVRKNPGLLVNGKSPVDFKHQENWFNAFDFEPLIPFMLTNQGPKMSSADINGDGLKDLVIAGGKGQSTKVYLQQEDGSFTQDAQPGLERFSSIEGIVPVLTDTDADGDADLIVGYGGNEADAYNISRPLLYFRNTKGKFTRDTLNFKGISLNASAIAAADYDGDGDTDLFVAAAAVPGKFGFTPKHYLFKNDGTGNFQEAERTEFLQQAGQLMDAKWTDVDGDNRPDLITAGYWTGIQIYRNKPEGFQLLKDEELTGSTGFWNCLEIADLNNDGRPDIIAGNWGLNSLWQADAEQPIRLYLQDFSGNGATLPVVTYFHNDTETPFNSKNELVKQIPQINKKYLSFQDFAKASVTDIFGAEKLNSALKLEVNTLASCYFINTEKGFVKYQLPAEAQASSIHAILADDVNNDGYTDLITGGNFYQLNLRLGRLDASTGNLLLNTGKGRFQDSPVPAKVYGEVRDLLKIKERLGTERFLFSVNNDSIALWQKPKR
ncbi:VCBS repeat-containing protein [Leeuwenhoekiella nanhaiensis]|uniref:ASPIC/UnbV domain-containing protein n=1 Tax=Leeuwenhoekiella nanhaiensis TaxID=1655491 RepID=A0A2G1VSU5_9FLAO|nr:VCBS repeat-containing protein [Leeuwenhoekiella nanhaiensis]PHQ29836.1 hypothetical protein CJ305_07660 [Leeuwenhoekiella nanhaiensis]